MDKRFWSLSQVDVDIAMRLQRWTAVGSIALVAATWRLWVPQTVFPQIPLFSILCSAPAWCDWICLACLLAGLVVTASGELGALEHFGMHLGFDFDTHVRQP